ncbi:MAG: hypothetical protein JWM80_2744 [Cyanobacteria bacterium RYN_339]|nr:hypothetical protein [Cyanobacteria bacterium RYN_339]
MPRATRTFNTDLAELAYQIGRSDAFGRINAEFQGRVIDDQEAQERVLELLDTGNCKLYGDHGPEEWSWALDERETSVLASTLYREGLGGT